MLITPIFELQNQSPPQFYPAMNPMWTPSWNPMLSPPVSFPTVEPDWSEIEFDLSDFVGEERRPQDFSFTLEVCKQETLSMIRGSKFLHVQMPSVYDVGYARMVVDKIGLNCPREYLNIEVAKRHFNSNIVNFVEKGGVTDLACASSAPAEPAG